MLIRLFKYDFPLIDLDLGADVLHVRAWEACYHLFRMIREEFGWSDLEKKGELGRREKRKVGRITVLEFFHSTLDILGLPASVGRFKIRSSFVIRRSHRLHLEISREEKRISVVFTSSEDRPGPTLL